jgi:hypothetical protein
VTVTNSENPKFKSTSWYFIEIPGLRICYDRDFEHRFRIICDEASLTSKHWSGIRIGTDGYPPRSEYGSYYIAGVTYIYFNATAIEFYGVKTQI